jgi:hypothetical protein
MSQRQELQQYLRVLADAGYTLRRTKRHWLVLDGENIVTGAASTPSEYRGLLNLRAAIRRWERSKENAALARSIHGARSAVRRVFIRRKVIAKSSFAFLGPRD